ncbi:MAG: lysophospholipid acyltransferase family protein [Desulfobacterales bacterium]|nr:lysophospholipid acyltransferase family protein [Desulfobacterales bacterium]
MDSEQFEYILRTRFGYHSRPGSYFLARNVRGWASFVFYARILKMILVDSFIAFTGRYNDKLWAASSRHTFRIVESAGGECHVSGLRELAGYRGPVVFIANHMSMLDTFFLPGLLLAFNKVTFVVKDSLLRYPVFGSIMRAVNPIAVTRKNPREDLKIVLSKGRDYISRGYSVAIFPQATRRATFETASFNSLGVKLARKAGVPVVPIALKTDFQSNGKIFKDVGPVDPLKTIRFRFGKPMPVEGSGHATHLKVVAFIKDNLKRWGADVR